jgi:hypothetical protein
MAMLDFGESKVTVRRSELLEALQKNRTKHSADYAEALAGYKVAFVEEAEKLLGLAKAGNFERQSIGLSEPKDHTKDYDRVIRMMTMCTADEITITEQQFSQFVLDEWQWQAAFNATKMRYSNAVAR